MTITEEARRLLLEICAGRVGEEAIAEALAHAREEGAAAEREACAKLCREAQHEALRMAGSYSEWAQGYRSALGAMRERIRARGEP